MKIAIVGPAYPYKGGIVQHTTELARRLAAAGHQVELVSWRAQYPFFYPGSQFAPGKQDESPPFQPTKRVLSWKNPLGWWLWGRRLRDFDQVILVWWVPTIQGPVYRTMLAAMGRKRPRVVMVCHNVLPHEARPGDKWLARSVARRADRLVVHSDSQAALAARLTSSEVRQVELPLAVSYAPTARGGKKGGLRHELLFFGFVRPYKGVDILLRALAQVSDTRLVIAGEIWGSAKPYTDLIEQLKLQDRVTIRDGYVPADELEALIRQADAVVMPYREGTASWNAALSHAYGTPVISTTVGSLAAQVRDGVDGLLCQPDNVESLAAAIRHFYEPGVAEKLRRGIPADRTAETWAAYVAAVSKD
jgi:glycosyltransferase involved in cell wall biosynthesis